MADYSLPAQIQQPNLLGAMGNLVDTARGIQAFQSGAIQQQRLGINLQSEVQANQERKNVIQAMQEDPDLQPGPNGTIDAPTAISKLQKIAPQTWATYAQNINTINQGVNTTNDQLMKNGSEALRELGQVLQPEIGTPMSNVLSVAKQWSDKQDTPAARNAYSMLETSMGKIPDPTNQKAVNAVTTVAVKRAHSLADQIDAQTAGTTFVSEGGQIEQKVTAPRLSGLPIGATVGKPIGTSLAPQVVFDAAGKPHFVGGMPSNGGTTGGAAGGTTWPSKIEVQAQSAAAEDMTNHFAGLNASSQSLPLVTSLTKTIEGLAPQAFTGPGGDKRQYMAGLARVFGINLTGDAQTDTNLLNKAIAQLNISTPAGTDAARLLVEAGQPNSNMDPAAIKEAAGTIRGQILMNQAERNFLTTTRYSNKGSGDPGTYQQGRQMFEANADPRVWQYEDLAKSNPAAARVFIARQPDKADLIRKTAALEQMGFFR